MRLLVVSSLVLGCAVSTLPSWIPTARGAEDWHHPLYLGNGGYWRQRVRVSVTNARNRDAAGEPVSLPIGRGPGEADLLNTRAEAIRLCDARGVELLFSIAGPAGEPIRRGVVPRGSRLIIPAECPAGKTATCHVYFDNPAAWAVPDFLETYPGVRNGGVEEGQGGTPSGWRHDVGDGEHQASWVSEGPHSGRRCLKTIVAEGAEPTWIATRQHGIQITGGARYEMRAWVRARDVEGFAGWYIHVGTEGNPMMLSPMLNAGGQTYGWKEVFTEFTAPGAATVADLGTVLRGTGTAWFDDVTLQCRTPSKLTVRAESPERLRLQESGRNVAWLTPDPRTGTSWGSRIPVTVLNFSDEPLEEQLVHVNLAAAGPHLRGRRHLPVRVVDGMKSLDHFRLQEAVLFAGSSPPKSLRTYHVYLPVDRPGGQTATLDYPALLESRWNLVQNPSFEAGERLPAAWSGAAGLPEGATLSLAEPGRFGPRCVRMHVAHDGGKTWTGWRQRVPVEPGRSYLYAGWVRCEDLRGTVQLHAHYRNAAGELAETKNFAALGQAVSGTKGWTLMSGVFKMPEDAATFELHLTMLASGTVWHDGVVLAEVTPGTLGKPEAPRKSLSGLSVWPVNPIVKVFPDDLPPERVSPARISAARNEREPLQLAVRSPTALGGLQLAVEPPIDNQGTSLTDFTVGVVGYVPLDHPTSYYRADSPAWHRKYPTGAARSDGWPGLWPDPLLPRSTFDLEARTTQPVWITVRVPKTAARGDYRGRIRLLRLGKTLQEVPFQVHVWDFTLPDASHVAAVYDLRLGRRWALDGKDQSERRREFWHFLADRRVCPDRVWPDPILQWTDGKVVANFTTFDRAAEYYLDELKLPHTYTPGCFYLFGWGHPPAARFGERPYEGDYPYKGTDRSKLRPEFKRAYQRCLAAYWQHMKEKGWADRCTLYISDEPYYHLPDIRQQMKALCDMIHEVDPEIPIYSSTWHHRPEWDGYLDVWGIGHYGVVPPATLSKLRSSGDRLWFTTDGQMCTDTPYCAVERLLPHYCFQYDVEAYEFWGVSWLTYDPYEFGWHRYIHQSGEPGESTWVRYPNGDGFLAYPGGPVGHDGPVSSVRLEQAREGVEDYEYLHLLRALMAKAAARERNTRRARKALEMARSLVSIPNAGGLRSSEVLPDPGVVLEIREAVAKAIEELSSSLAIFNRTGRVQHTVPTRERGFPVEPVTHGGLGKIPAPSGERQDRRKKAKLELSTRIHKHGDT